MNSLKLKDAAEFVGCHAVTLAERAAAGVIPGCKVGKEWRFLDVDLVQYMRQQYPSNQTGDKKCLSTRVVKRGGSTSRTRESELESLLGQKTSRKLEESTTKLKLIYGIENDPGQP